MATTLTDKNINSVIKDIPKKGFLPKFWQEYRSKVTSGSGVAVVRMVAAFRAVYRPLLSLASGAPTR